MSRRQILYMAKFGVIVIVGMLALYWVGRFLDTYASKANSTTESPYSIDTLYFQEVEDIVVHMPSGKTYPLVSDGINTYIQCRVRGEYTYVPFQFDTSQMKIRAVYDSTKTQ